MICLISDQSNEPTKNLISLKLSSRKCYHQPLARRGWEVSDKVRNNWSDRRLSPPSCWVSQVSPCSIERTHIGSVWSPFNGHNLDMRGVSDPQSRHLRKKWETWRTEDWSLIAEIWLRLRLRLRWCGVTVRLGEFMYQIMESPAITQMTVDGREIWLIVLLGAVQSIMCL